MNTRAIGFRVGCPTFFHIIRKGRGLIMATKQEIKKRQCLLLYLGYYVGDVDGVWGQMSKTAVKAFKGDFGGFAVNDTVDEDTLKAMQHAVAYGMPAKKEEAPTSGDFWDGIKYFQKAEFRCKCGCGADSMEEKLVKTADKVRGYFGNPMTVSSGRRCTTHNARVGGVSNSRHLTGKAMDFCVRGMSASMVLTYVQNLPEIRYAYAIDNNYVHMDVE